MWMPQDHAGGPPCFFLSRACPPLPPPAPPPATALRVSRREILGPSHEGQQVSGESMARKAVKLTAAGRQALCLRMDLFCVSLQAECCAIYIRRPLLRKKQEKTTKIGAPPAIPPSPLPPLSLICPRLRRVWQISETRGRGEGGKCVDATGPCRWPPMFFLFSRMLPTPAAGSGPPGPLPADGPFLCQSAGRMLCNLHPAAST